MPFYTKKSASAGWIALKILTNRDVVVWRDVLDPLAPLDEGHGAAHGHAGDVQVGVVLHLVHWLGLDREAGRHASH